MFQSVCVILLLNLSWETSVVCIGLEFGFPVFVCCVKNPPLSYLSSPALLRRRLGGTPTTPAERLQLLSPAARKLASRSATPGSSRGVDKALRQSYTPQRVRTPGSTPSSTPSSTPRQPSGRATPREEQGSSTPSLTDNLLNLKNR